MRTLVIVNPASAGGRTAERWPQLLPHARRLLGDFELAMTTRAGDAERWAREAVARGPHRIVAVGGDGTNHEVANGMVDLDVTEPTPPESTFAFVAMGTGCDLGRTFDLPREPLAALEAIASRPARPMDAMRVESLGHDGTPWRRIAINIVSMGLGGHSVYLVEKRPKFGTTLPFYLAGLEALFRSAPWPLRLGLADGSRRDVRARYVVIANGRFNGGGMQIARDARIDDGLLDVITVGPVGKLRLVALTSHFYDGSIVDHPLSQYFRTSALQVTPDAGAPPIYVEADGEVAGLGPATVTLLPAALRVHA